MYFQLTMVQKPGYLHGIATGQNSRENVVAYLIQGLRECEARACTRVLIESRLQGPRLAPWDSFEIASWHARFGKGVFDAIAYVDVNAPADILDFVQDVAAGRGLPLRSFATVEAAEAWLASTIEAPQATS